MNVAELIERLKKMPQNAIVLLRVDREGDIPCDYLIHDVDKEIIILRGRE